MENIRVVNLVECVRRKCGELYSENVEKMKEQRDER